MGKANSLPKTGKTPVYSTALLAKIMLSWRGLPGTKTHDPELEGST